MVGVAGFEPTTPSPPDCRIANDFNALSINAVHSHAPYAHDGARPEGGRVMGDSIITQQYLRRYPTSKRAKSWAGRLVHIQTENGVWRVNGCGYTYAGKPDAWVLQFEEAQRKVSHCGPEKRAAFIWVKAEPSAEECR